VSLLVAGYYYIFSAGDSEKANKAKTIIKWNIIAILVAFLSYGIVSIVASFFGT
jgi:VIT1/CCC1 family predicted Fe2+/Mn2+ transporter